jgi:aryl-alcohol dehydrogenase-like predicted oxidoreductase
MTQRPEGYVEYASDAVFDALERLEEEARRRGVSMAGLALAWLLAQEEITAVVVGPGRPEHLEPVREALDLQLDRADAARLTKMFA